MSASVPAPVVIRGTRTANASVRLTINGTEKPVAFDTPTNWRAAQAIYTFGDYTAIAVAKNAAGLSSATITRPFTAMSIYDQLRGVDWTYQKLLEAADIPLPTCSGCVDVGIRQLYSPSVTRFNGKYVMLFGVAVVCRPPSTGTPNWSAFGGFFGRDSIALADSDDGLAWTFQKYVLEPDIRMCTVQRSLLPTGIDAQVIDPYIWVEDGDPSTLHVLYTNASWEPDIFFDANAQTCGHIGYATIDTSYDVTVVNRRFLNGRGVANGLDQTGYSRPTLQWLSATEKRVWGDNAGQLWSAPFVNPQPNVQGEEAVALDVDTPKLSYDDGLLLLYNGIGISGSIRLADNVWQGPYQITELSGQDWDTEAHGSPHLYLDPATCTPWIYFAGFASGVGVIAVATPPDQDFSFPLCEGP